MEPATELKPRDRILAFMEAHNLTIESFFVPFSQSRNKDKKDSKNRPRPSLNWRVMLKKGDRLILETDYSSGAGQCPSYKGSWGRPTPEQVAKIAFECEIGFAVYRLANYRSLYSDRQRPIKPDPCDVLYSLASESDVMDYNGFADWAESMGFDSDSIKNEAIYRACLDIALRLHNGLGAVALDELREACQDY